MPKTNHAFAPVRAVLIAHNDVGNCAAIWVKIITDMPLPIPRSVISSPIHMMIEVPAVIVRIITITGNTPCE